MKLALMLRHVLRIRRQSTERGILDRTNVEEAGVFFVVSDVSLMFRDTANFSLVAFHLGQARFVCHIPLMLSVVLKTSFSDATILRSKVVNIII